MYTVRRTSSRLTPGTGSVSKEELDKLAELQARWEERGYRLVLVAVRARHTEDRLARFAAERQPPGELLYDSTGTVAQTLQADGLPTHVLFDAEGALVHRSQALDEGFLDALSEHMRGVGRERGHRQ